MSIDDLQFGELSPKKEKIAQKASQLIPLDVGDIDVGPPPGNSSAHTRGELRYIAHIAQNYHIPENSLKILDKDFLSLFFDYAEAHKLTYDSASIKDLVEDSTHLILRLKKKYNRPRPYQIAPYHDVELSHNSEIQEGAGGTAKSPSYPSGHTTQAYLAAELLAKENPSHRESLMEIAEQVSMARIKEGLHYPTDNEFGKVLVRNYIMPSLEKKVYLKTKSKTDKTIMATLPYKYTTTFKEEILATSTIESGEWQLSKASLQQLKQLIPADIDFEKNIDLLGVAFNAAVVNRFNKNDDGIDTQTALAIKDYFVNKPTNIEHQKQKVVGHIVSSAFSKFPTNEIIEDAAVRDKKEPFNIACAAVVYRTVNRAFTDLLQDEDGGFDEKISASWEIGFNDYQIALGSKDLTYAEIITDELQIAEFSNYLKANEGPGQLEDGTKVYRLVKGDIYPLGIGFTTNPAADVEGLITQHKNEDVETHIALAPEAEGTVIEVNNPKFIKNLKSTKNKISQMEKKDVISSQTPNSKFMETEILDKLDRVLKEHDYAKEFSQEAVASIGEVVEEAIRQRSDEYVAEKEKAAKAETALAEAEENFKKSFEVMEKELADTKEKIEILEAENAEREAKEVFNSRMGALDETYELDEEDRKILARDLAQLDTSEQSFTDYEQKAAVVWRHKDKELLQKQQEEMDAQIQEEVEKRLAQISEASTKESDTTAETVEEALQNASEEKLDVPNNSEAAIEEEDTLQDRFAKAFSKENLTINY